MIDPIGAGAAHRRVSIGSASPADVFGGDEGAAQPGNHTETMRLTVLKGRHEGASLAVNHREFTIGSSLDSDIVLTDSGVADSHVRVRRSSATFIDRIEVTALADNVIVGTEAPPVGARTTVTLPIDIHVGDSLVRIESDNPGKALKSTLSLIPLGIVTGLAFGLVLPMLPVDLASLRTTFGTSATSTAAQPASGSPAALDALRSRIEEAGLTSVVETQSRGSAIVARGRAGPAELERWRSLRAKLAAEHPSAQIVDLVGPASSAALPSSLVAAVVTRPVAIVIGTDGRRAGIGETLSDGWIVKEITADAVVIERGRQTERIAY